MSTSLINLPILKSYNAPSSNIIYTSGIINPTPLIPLYQTNGTTPPDTQNPYLNVNEYSTTLVQLSNGLYSWNIKVSLTGTNNTTSDVTIPGASYTTILPLNDYTPTVNFGNTFSVGYTSAVVPVTFATLPQYIFGGTVQFSITLESPYVFVVNALPPSSTPPSIIANFNIVPATLSANSNSTVIIASVDYLIYGVPN